MESGLIALLTDFGESDIYVGIMKGVIKTLHPRAEFVDITHNIQPQNVRQAAFSLLNAYRYFPTGTIFLVVVDPGVGSTRKPIAVQAGGHTFIAPDNGVISYALSELENMRAVELSNAVYQLFPPSNTFHGRDIFAPAAAHIAGGVPLERLGPLLERIFRLPLPQVRIEGSRIVGQVIHIDHFGNVITNIGHLDWVTPEQLRLEPGSAQPTSPVLIETAQASVLVNDHSITEFHQSYGVTARGTVLALVDSNGNLEIAANHGSAASRLQVALDDRVELQIGIP
jgi:S-adenosyl-L-methionine hydrolase (adenosine-forming)